MLLANFPSSETSKASSELKRGEIASPRIASKAFYGTMWLLGGRFYRQIISLVGAIVLGRLLNPRDFGMVGIADLAIQFVSVFTNTGFNDALIQKSDISPLFLHTAWLVKVVRSVFIATCLWLAAPIIAAFFNESDATPVLRALAGVHLFSGFVSMGGTLWVKDLKFRSIFVLEVSRATLDMAVSIIVAILWRNVWALVLGAFAGAVANVTLSYAMHPYKPKLTFHFQAARELFKFGQWLLLSTIFHFLLTKGTDVMSGYLFGATALGLYQMASRFALLPTNHLGEVFLQVMFPAYSNIQDDPERLRFAFIKVIQVVTFTIFPLSALMAVAVGPVLPLILGHKWENVVALMPGLALGGAMQALLRTGHPLFMARGKPKDAFILNLFSGIGIALCILPLTKLLGLPGLSWAYALGMSLGFPLWCYFIHQQVNVSIYDLISSLFPALMASLIMCGCILGTFKHYKLPLDNFGSLYWLIASVLIGIVCYLTFNIIMERILINYKPLQEMMTLFKTAFIKRLYKYDTKS